jgi:hypothetical protein
MLGATASALERELVGQGEASGRLGGWKLAGVRWINYSDQSRQCSWPPHPLVVTQLLKLNSWY